MLKNDFPADFLPYLREDGTITPWSAWAEPRDSGFDFQGMAQRGFGSDPNLEMQHYFRGESDFLVGPASDLGDLH
jgi:hypothetical protein